MSHSAAEQKPWIFTGTLQLSPIKRISPSRYTALSECRLREVWAAAGHSPLLPVSPTARFGTAAHNMIELAGNAELANCSITEIDKKFSEILERIENRMKASWLESFLVPLSESVSDYQVRRIRVCKRAFEIAKTAVVCAAATAIRSQGNELWVESVDGRVGGKIDQVVKTSDELIIRDFKTGYIHEASAESNAHEIKQSYQIQLKLYAALYFSNYRQWPDRLEIVPLSGEPWEVPFTPEECIDLLKSACQLLISTNKIIELSGASDPIEELATEKPTACRFCLYRPACKMYRHKQMTGGDARWPTDVLGVVTEMRTLNNGSMWLQIEREGGNLPAARIRSLTPSEVRHPIFTSLGRGMKVGLYNLRGDIDSGALQEGPYTVIYQH